MIDPQDMSPRNEAEEPGRATLPGVALAVLPGPRAAAAEASGAFPLARTAAMAAASPPSCPTAPPCACRAITRGWWERLRSQTRLWDS